MRAQPRRHKRWIWAAAGLPIAAAVLYLFVWGEVTHEYWLRYYHRRATQDVPVGSSHAQVEKWLADRSIEHSFYPIHNGDLSDLGHGPYEGDLPNPYFEDLSENGHHTAAEISGITQAMVRDTGWTFPLCGHNVRLTFYFDRQDRLIVCTQHTDDVCI